MFQIVAFAILGFLAAMPNVRLTWHIFATAVAIGLLSYGLSSNTSTYSGLHGIYAVLAFVVGTQVSRLTFAGR